MPSAMSRRLRFVAILAAGLGVAACGGLPGTGDLEDPAEIMDVPVDGADMIARLNAYRAANGLPDVRPDPALAAVSQDMARHIARRDSMDTWQHSAFGLSQRLEKAGYANYAAAENLGAGYADLAAAFQGWQGSEGHDKNLLNPYVTRAGIARTNRATGKWRNFWVLTLARPVEDGRPGPVR